ncbi:hypothetical protein JCM8097_004964 [Rhodosporidiobolus ruineniae]
MATASTVELNAPHRPLANSIRAFSAVEDELKRELIKLRHHWDQHEARMFSRAEGVSDTALTQWKLDEDLVSVRAASTAYGSIILSKLRLPALSDGYIHVRIHDSPGAGQENVKFHSIWTNEVREEKKGEGEGRVVEWEAIQTAETPLEFFNE